MPKLPLGPGDNLRQLPIETVRAIAILVLVSFHPAFPKWRVV